MEYPKNYNLLLLILIVLISLRAGCGNLPRIWSKWCLLFHVSVLVNGKCVLSV